MAALPCECGDPTCLGFSCKYGSSTPGNHISISSYPTLPKAASSGLGLLIGKEESEEQEEESLLYVLETELISIIRLVGKKIRKKLR